MEKPESEILSFKLLEIGYSSGKSGKALLPPLNASATEGELIAVVGKNGIGKSTLLRTIAGLQPFLGGKLFIQRRHINEFSRNQLSEKVGYISTEIIRVSNMRVYDLVSQGRFPYTDWFGRIDAANHNAIMDALYKAGMATFSERPVSELSDGERQKAMIAMVLAQDAKLMVMDEPTAFLDISSRYEIMHLLHDLTRQRNKTVIYSTHDLSIAISQADKVWLLLDDSMCEGAPEDLIMDGSFRHLFDASKVNFNPDDGSFSLKNEIKGTVRIVGNGIKRIWTEKAVRRAGYSVTDSGSAISISLASEVNPMWTCTMAGHSGEFGSVYELIRWIRKMESIS